MTPNVYVRYALPSRTIDDYMQCDLTSHREAFFHLCPHYSLHGVFPPMLSSFNSIMASLLLPLVHTSVVIFSSNLLTVSYVGGESPHLEVVLNSERVSKFSLLLCVDRNSIDVEAMRCRIPVNPEWICCIHYSVYSPQQIILQINSNILKIKVVQPIENSAEHIASVRLTNMPATPEPSCHLGVIGIFYYTFFSKENWISIPYTGTLFTMMGGRVVMENGLHDEKEQIPKGCLRCALALVTDAEAVVTPWSSFMFPDQRIQRNRNVHVYNEFCFYNSVCCFDFFVSWDTQEHKCRLGYGARTGILYWKTALQPQSFALRYGFSLHVSSDSYCIWWLSNQALPSHLYMSVIGERIAKYIRMKTGEGINLSVDFQLPTPVAFVIAYRRSERSICVQYGLTKTVQETFEDSSTTKYYLSLWPCATLSSDSGYDVEIRSNASGLVLALNGMRLYASSALTLPTEMAAQGVMGVTGFMGLDATVRSYHIEAASDQESSILACASSVVLRDASTMTSSEHFSVTPCEVKYRQHAAYGSEDLELSNPKEFTVEGDVFALDRTLHNYAVVGRDPTRSFLFYMELHADVPARSCVCVFRDLNCSVKRVKQRKDSIRSCFVNNRLSAFEKNSSGLVNSNNTCFQNSTLQLLFHSDALKRSILSFYQDYAKSPCDKSTDDFVCMRELVMMMTRLQVSIRSVEFNNVMLALAKRFEIGYQHVGTGERRES